MNDILKPTGEIVLHIFEAEKPVQTIRFSNLVVTLGKTNIAKLLGGDPAGLKIDRIGVGTSATPAAVGDSAITGMFSKTIDSVTYPDAQSVQFNFDIDNGEANGITIRELGLLNSSNVLFARKVRSEIVKTNLIRIVGSWKITIN